MCVPARQRPHRIVLSGRRLTAILAVAFAATACGGPAAAPSAAVLASSVGSVAPTAPGPSSGIPQPTLPAGRLVFAQFIGEVGSLFTVDPEGTGMTPLLPSGTAELPRWSPDGSRISVVAHTSREPLFVAIVNSDGSNYRELERPDPTLDLGCFAWSPDGSRLACEGWDDGDPSRNGIYTVRSSDGGCLVRVTACPSGGHDIPTDYSPDGRQLVFTRDRGLADGSDTTLMVTNVDGTGARVLSDRKLGQARWSPDGRTILTDDGASLLLVPIDGGEIRSIEIVPDSLETAFFGSWSPDGEWIVFSGRGSRSVDLYIVRADGTGLHQVTDTPLDRYEDAADWGVPAP